MDDYRRYRDNNSRKELFSGATNNQEGQGGGYPPPSSGYPPPPSGYPPPPSGYPPPPSGYGNPYYGQPPQQQETEEDIDEIKSQIKATKQDSVASTMRSLKLIDEAETSAQTTLNKLAEQSHRINYTDRQLDLADAHAERAEQQAAKLKKINGSMFGFDISNPFTKKKREAAELARVQALQEEQRTSRENMRAANWDTQQRVNNVQKQTQQSYAQRPNNSSTSTSTSSTSRSRFQFEADEEDNQLEDQIDNNLEALSSGLSRLNAMAVASGDEIRKQNVVLDRISNKTNELDTRIAGTTHKLKKIK
ncbi:hypothetical protein Glove_284g101 [Diversispora epigaea]|uniref:t-SNARE coiled-coil homology domain-containing protein n=1 Tax=Diversispora epigaea TaxID=1348612 RepID=A0A397I554_9GLOM|nr:hypothetical protein Glove_284g101 [Diversispora epigaea]